MARVSAAELLNAHTRIWQQLKSGDLTPQSSTGLDRPTGWHSEMVGAIRDGETATDCQGNVREITALLSNN
jgi:hypothetical protein